MRNEPKPEYQVSGKGFLIFLIICGSLIVLCFLFGFWTLGHFDPMINFITGRYSWVQTQEIKELYRMPYPGETLPGKFKGPVLVVWAETGKIRWDVQRNLPSKIQPQSQEDLATVVFINRSESQAGTYTPGNDPAYATTERITVISYPDGSVLACGSLREDPPIMKIGRGEYHTEPPSTKEILLWLTDHCDDIRWEDIRW